MNNARPIHRALLSVSDKPALLSSLKRLQSAALNFSPPVAPLVYWLNKA